MPFEVNDRVLTPNKGVGTVIRGGTDLFLVGFEAFDKAYKGETLHDYKDSDWYWGEELKKIS
jgi:hypothetical protein